MLIFAYITDKIGRKPLLIAGCLILLIFSYPLFLVISTGQSINIIFAYLGLILAMAIYYGAVTITMVELFPAHVRYTAVALGHGLTFALFGGTSPLIAALLIHSLHTLTAPSLTLILSSAISLISVLTIPTQKLRAS